MRRCCGWHRSMWAGLTDGSGREKAHLQLSRQRHHPAASRRAARLRRSYDEIDVGSPFSYEDRRYFIACAPARPKGGHFEAAMHDELVALIEASRPGTCAVHQLAAMQAAAEVVRGRTR